MAEKNLQKEQEKLQAERDSLVAERDSWKKEYEDKQKECEQYLETINNLKNAKPKESLEKLVKDFLDQLKQIHF